MKLRRLRRARLALTASFLTVDADLVDYNHPMVARMFGKVNRLVARANRRPPRRLSAYLRGNPRLARTMASGRLTDIVAIVRADGTEQRIPRGALVCFRPGEIASVAPSPMTAFARHNARLRADVADSPYPSRHL